jgi:ABC-type glycerol-3-phosphate transport system substrate-binding protein
VTENRSSGGKRARLSRRVAALAVIVAASAAGVGALAAGTHGATAKKAAAPTLQLWHWQQQATGYPDVFQASIDR